MTDVTAQENSGTPGIAPMPAAGPSAATLARCGTVAAVLGAGLMVLVHELVHLVTGLVMGVPGTLYSFGVEQSGTPTQNGIMASSAPLASLVSGLLLTRWLPLRRRGGFGHLLWLFFAFSSCMEGIGYLVITPFGAGDTAAAVGFFGWPAWAPWVMFAVGVAGQFGLARMFAPHVGRHAGPDRRSRLALAFWPWLFGTVVNMLLAGLSVATARMDLTGGEAVAVVVAGCATLVFAPMSLMYRRALDREPYQPLRLPQMPVAGLGGVAALIVLNQALNVGLRIG